MEDLESQQRSRMCPNMLSCWSDILWKSYSLNTNDRTVLLRRVCMIFILGIRTALAVVDIARSACCVHLASAVVGSMPAVLGIFFNAWCLARIGDMDGERVALGRRWNRSHFDAFLFVCALMGVFTFAVFFVGLGLHVFTSFWLLMWFLIYAVAWVATWAPKSVAL